MKYGPYTADNRYILGAILGEKVGCFTDTVGCFLYFMGHIQKNDRILIQSQNHL